MSSSRSVHIIGAGMAGLSAALHLALTGERVHVYEAAPHAGGRCRSYVDRELGCRIDNGNHLVLSGNVAVQDYLALSDATDTVRIAPSPSFPFMDLASGERWTVSMGQGRVPLWLLNARKRVPGTRPTDYLNALRLLRARESTTVAALLKDKSALYRRFWEPLTVAALNTEPETASAKLLAAIVAQSFGAGGAACRPLIPREGLSESFVTPCLKKLETLGGALTLGARLRGMDVRDGAVQALDFGDMKVALKPGDWVVLAVPPWVAQDLVPGIVAPNAFRSILNVHYRIEAPTNEIGFTGLVGGIAEWVFVKPGIVSITISAAERFHEAGQESWAYHVWQDIAKLFDLNPEILPPWRVVREKRATFAATPAQNALRPQAWIGWKNLALAGDWTDTGLPSTIEGALRSGMKAAQLVLRWQ